MARTISTKLAIDGEAQNKQSVAACNSVLSALKSNLALVQSEFRNNANSMDALTAKGNALGTVYDKQLEKVVDLEAALLNARNAVAVYAEKQADLKSRIEANNQAIGAFDEASKKAGEQWAKYADDLKKSESALEALKQKSGDTSSEQAKLEASIAKARAEMEKLESSTNGTARQVGEFLQENKQLSSEFEKNSAYLDSATRGANSWEKQLNSAKIELNGLSDKIEQNNQYLREAEESADGCATSIDRYGKEVKEAGNSSEDFAAGTEQSKLGIEQLASALAAAGVAKTVKEIADELMACAGAAAEFETAIAKLSTLIDASVYPMEDIKAQLVELSNETGVAVGALAEAAYQAQSAGVDTADVISFVSTATKTSVAGFTDSATSVDVLTTAINAYKLEGSDAERVASMLVKTQDEGKTSVGELAQNMGRIIPVAAAYKVNLGNLNTAYALLTKNGTNTRIATTNLSAMFTELAKEGSTVADVLQRETGKSFAELSDGGTNLGEVMKILADSVDGDATAFSNLWSSSTAGQAALSLLNSGVEEFNRTLEVMETSSGAVDRNFQTMADTTEFAQQRMANAAENLRIAIGEQLNPALEKLYETGADAFTWATDFVNEHPEVVAAFTAVSVGMGVLVAGVTLAANAETIMAAATGALNAVMSANPAFLMAAGVTALVAAVGAFIATSGQGTDEAREFSKALKESKSAYDDLMSSMEEQRASTATLVTSLKDLLSVEAKSTTQKDRIKLKVDELNKAVSGLNLTYDEATDSIINMDTGVKMTTEDIDAMLERAAKQEEYNAQLARLNELENERTEIANRLREARAQLEEVEEKSAETSTRVYSEQLEQRAVAANLRSTIEELTAAEADNAAQIAELEAATESFADGQGAAEQKIQEMQTTVDRFMDELTKLQEAYEESHQKAMESIEGQLGLFNKLDGEAKTSIGDLIDTLKGQVEYMETYAANIQKAMEMGVDEGLVRKLSDGSEESAQILAAIVEGGEEDIRALNEQLAKVEEGKESFSTTIADMETDFKKKMDQIAQDLNGAFREMELQQETYRIGQNNINGLIQGTASQRQALINQYAQMGRDALAAYKAAVDQHSPSKKFDEAGSNDIQGIIEGAERKKQDLAAAYDDVANAALVSMERHLPSTIDVPDPSVALSRQAAAIMSAASNRDWSENPIQIHVDKLEVRSDSDIDRIARKLYDMLQREGRSRGGGGL